MKAKDTSMQGLFHRIDLPFRLFCCLEDEAEVDFVDGCGSELNEKYVTLMASA